MNAEEALSRLWNDAGGDTAALDLIDITGSDPVLPSSFRADTAAAAAIAASSLATAEYGRVRGGEPQRVSVDLRAAAASFAASAICASMVLQLHTNFPNHRQAALATLQCAGQREAVAASLERWSAEALETALADAGGCGVAVRSVVEWRAHPQAAAIATLPVLEIRRIGDSEPEALPPAERR